MLNKNKGKFSTSTPIFWFLPIPRLFLVLAPTSFKISYLTWHDSVLNAIPALLSSIHIHSDDALTLYTGFSALKHKDADSLEPSFQVPAACSAFSSYKLYKEINNSSFFNIIFVFFFLLESIYIASSTEINMTGVCRPCYFQLPLRKAVRENID